MSMRMKFLAITALTAGLFMGSAALAQGIPQSEKVAYALTLIDAGADGSGNSETGVAITDATKTVRVKVTVSVPRTSATYGAIPMAAKPARLMYRMHKGTSTAFNGSISLTRDAPYAADGTPLTTAYYPMPQSGTSVNFSAVKSGESENVNNETVADYLSLGQLHNPARWECTFLSPVYNITEEGFAETHPMIQSLLDGKATYEWYAASFYGIGFSRISPIQDIGRAMSFTDIRLWEPVATDPDPFSAADAAGMDAGSQATLGTAFEWHVRAMPEAKAAPGWHIYRASIGVNASGADAGVQLLNVPDAEPSENDSFNDNARIESPRYPDGIGSISFRAKTSLQDTNADNKQMLRIQYATDANWGLWRNLEDVELTTAFTSYTIDFKGLANRSARFRIVRITELAVSGAADLATVVVQNLLVRSAAPGATFGKPAFSPANPAYTTYDADGNPDNRSFKTIFTATGESGVAKPRGYAATLDLRRRAAGDNSNAWYTAPVAVTFDDDGGAEFVSTFARRSLVMNADGTTNAPEGSFFLNADGTVVGLMPGVYDLALDYQIYGSFAAGRNLIDQHETVSGSASTYAVEVPDSLGGVKTEHHPNILNLREQETANNDVFLRVMYRSGTRDSSAPYTLKTLDVPLLPSAQRPNVWRVDLARKLRLEDETAEYVWGYDPKSADPASDSPLVYEENKIAFTVCAETTAGVTWYGQKGAADAVPGVMPLTTTVVPAITETLGVAASEAAAVPVVLDVETLKNSHVMIELTLPDGKPENAAADIFARMAGSYWQDFNTWHAPSENFTETDFRESAVSRTADFDCTVEEEDGEYFVTDGWIPDEGPLAASTSFTDTFDVGRSGIEGYTFFMPDLANQSLRNFASWGASSTRAEPYYLREDEDIYNFNTAYMQLDESAEVVLNREALHPSSDYLPDALIRLRGTGCGILPLSKGSGGVVLNGVGTVRFKLGISYPYNISQRVCLLSADSNSTQALSGYGIAAGVQTESRAASGYSVSYYLEEVHGRTKYELRLTQITDFGTSTTEAPEPMVVAELYRWTGSVATRLMLQKNSDVAYYFSVGRKLEDSAYGLWITDSGKLAIGWATGSLTPNLTTTTLFSRDAVVNLDSGTKYTAAFGAAECRPVFRQIMRTTTPVLSFGDGDKAITPSEVYIEEPYPPAWAAGGISWSVSTEASGDRIRISRIAPDPNAAGSVLLRAIRDSADGGLPIDPKLCSTDETGTEFTVTLGAANATLQISPAGEESNVFLDDITVSSWCGNDANRNGKEYVPARTDVGFFPNNGFAGVGLWICPDTPDQKTALPSEYRGNQCLLMQRSRQNLTDNPAGEIEIGGIRTTAGSLALYGPYSENGLGTVTFRYKIPQEDEFVGNGALSSVHVMLQYLPDGEYYNNYLGNALPSGWMNVSEPVELRNTAGEWRTASITPKLNGNELVGEDGEGTLRLVMVTEYLDDDDDPYVYIDDFTVTDNATGSLASWSATNVKLTEAPVNLLYWKDRAATESAHPEEKTFAEKSSLTRALQFNDTGSGDDTDGPFDFSFLNSPILENGVGRISFAARLTEPNAKPVRLYIWASENADDSDMESFMPVTYVEVASTVYTVYDIDLSKYRYYYTTPLANLLPGTHVGSTPFSSQAVRRIRLRTNLEDDESDAFDDTTPNAGRVLIDAVSISDPVLPSLRVESVAFSNVAGGDNPEEFIRTSPLSQPVSNAPVLRTMVELGHLQLLKDDTIRVFLTLNPHDVTSSPYLMRYESGYSYMDAVGNTVTASPTRPIYAWSLDQTAKWPLAEWFNLNNLYTAEGGAKRLEEIQTVYRHTIELERKLGTNCFFGDLSKIGVKDLPVNSLVQYTAWAVYQSEESDQWFAAKMTPTTYTDFPWNFPRNLNQEIQAVAKSKGETFSIKTPVFSPYYWVYSCLPGEVFINEFDLRNPRNAEAGADSFVEVCAPAGLDIGGWKLNFSGQGTTELVSDMTWSIDDGTMLQRADAGAVPERRNTGSASNRAFYTVFSDDSPVYSRVGGAADGAHEEKFDTETFATVNTKNGGVAVRGLEYANLGGNMTASVQLLRPTGGAEHIVVFSMAGEGTITADEADVYQENIDKLYAIYQAAYASNGFGSEWYQTFLDGSWAKYGNDDAFGKLSLHARDLAAGLTPEKAHGRRLAKANYYPQDPATGRYLPASDLFGAVQDYALESFGNSIATVDMGGVWVTRLNAIDSTNANGPLDLTQLCYGTWPAEQNPVLQPRAGEPSPDDPTGIPTPYTQVTPRQINPDQYLVKYSGLSQSVVVSSIGGNALGHHKLEIYNPAGTELTETRYGGRTSPTTWSIDLTVKKVRLTYTALPFQTIESVKLRFVDSKQGDAVTEEGLILGQLDQGQELQDSPDDEGWVTLKIADGATAYTLIASLPKPGGSEEERYNLEATAVFKVVEDGAKDVIEHVAPYCGGNLGGSAPYQPWWGSGFGFTVDYDESMAQGAVLSGFIVTYPSPEGLATLPWDGFRSPWTGLNLTLTDGTQVSLVGKEYDEAIDLLKNTFGPEGKARYVEITGAADGHAADTSLIGILGDTYAKAALYDGTLATAKQKEPAIPFCVWGIYTCTVQRDVDTEKIAFLMPQAPGSFSAPSWYAPLEDLNAGKSPENTIPYFYLYSTPPQAAWLNEVNVVKGLGSAPYAEVVMPHLRQGILDAMPTPLQTTLVGWHVTRYAQDGTSAAGQSLEAAVSLPAHAYGHSYTYNTVGLDTVASPDLSAYVLTRPCGAAEGGVWIKTDAAGNGPVEVPGGLDWLSDPAKYHVVSGKTDATDAAGSVQLIGRRVNDGTFERLSSAVADRTEWAFAEETQNAANRNGDTTVSPETKPEWNQVTVASHIRNTVYGGVLCGYQFAPGLFEGEGVDGATPSTAASAPVTLSGAEWVYDEVLNNRTALSYRPRAGYRFESITLPPELIGRVMLIGRDGSLPADVLATEVARLRARGEADSAVRVTEWLQMGLDIAGAPRATVEYSEYINAAGVTVREPTGLIRFNTDFVVSNTDGELVTFGDQSNFVISLVFIDEPPSAQNRIEVAMGQGDVQTGAWLVTQTFWVQDASGKPDAAKGGDTVTSPIWSDEDGNVNGEHKNVHGWVHQPVIGDKLGMSAVINPELGLIGVTTGNSLEAVRARLEEGTTLRPFLVWTLIPKSKVPGNLFDPTRPEGSGSRSKFLTDWALPRWIGGSPSVADSTIISLTALRRGLQNVAGSSTGLYNAAGIIPMAYRGYCDTDGNLGDPTVTTPTERAANTLLAFSTMDETELAAALGNTLSGLSNEDAALLNYTSAIDMNGELWDDQDGAVLRFAIVLANPQTGDVYDCQGLANFSTGEKSVYCPWYVPNAASNINFRTSAEEYGVSPFAWVYKIRRGGVWLNEARPFATRTANGILTPSAIELAMYASPYTQVGNTYVPEYTLDGWKLEMKYAEMPLIDAKPDEPIDWVSYRTINLAGWIPYRRIQPTNANNTPNFYDLDYYAATTQLDASFTTNKLFTDESAYSDQTRDTFNWFRLPDELFDETVEAELRASYASKPEEMVGFIYSVSLVRNNGVVVDEVIFHTSTAGLNQSQIPERIQRAVESENANNRAASDVRAPSVPMPMEGAGPEASAQFLKWTKDGNYYWLVSADSSAPNTFPGANSYGNSAPYEQPYVSYKSMNASLTARVFGGDAVLSLAQANSLGVLTGTALSTVYRAGTAYTLALSDWNRQWYTLSSVQKNGQPLTNALSAATVYAVDSAGLLSTSQQITIDEDTLTEDTDYSLIFVYTPAASQLVASGDLNSQDDSFLAWLLRADPEAILQQTEQDGVTASEKYWLGLDSAKVDASDVNLAITAIGTHAEPEETLPLIRVSLKQGDTEISELTGDGVLVLLGRKTLDEPWQYVRRLYPDDINGESNLILRTPCTFFKAVLLSEVQAEEYK